MYIVQLTIYCRSEYSMLITWLVVGFGFLTRLYAQHDFDAKCCMEMLNGIQCSWISKLFV